VLNGPSITLRESRQLLDGTMFFAIEIGNECDLYGFNGIRTSNWNYTYYSQQFENYYKAIISTNVAPNVPFIQGATWCCESSFLLYANDYIKTYKPILRTFSYHKYPLNVCDGATTNLVDLMQDRAASGEADAMKPYVQDAIKDGVDFWMGEVNSVACGGAYNVSNTMGSALWTLDYLFNFANISVVGMNFHGGTSGAYSSFTYSPSTSNVPVVHPEYYGFYLFAQSIQGGAALTPVTTQFTNNTFVKVWSVKGTKDNSVRVVILHKDIASTVNAKVDISIDVPGYDPNAVYYELSAPSPYSTDKLTIGGQTFDNTVGGEVVGKRTAQTLKSVDNIYSITIKPSTAILLVISPSTK